MLIVATLLKLIVLFCQLDKEHSLPCCHLPTIWVGRVCKGWSVWHASSEQSCYLSIYWPVYPSERLPSMLRYTSSWLFSLDNWFVQLSGGELDQWCLFAAQDTCGNESVENSLTHHDLLLSLVLKVCLFVKSNLSHPQSSHSMAGLTLLPI